MIPYMVGKLASNSSHLTRGLFKYVPGRGYFRAVSSQSGDEYVTSPPPPPIVERVFCAFRKGRAGDERMHDLIKFFFWLQVASDFTLKLKWVCSADNKDADDLTRPGAVDHVRLEQRCFVCSWEKWGGFDMDLMATGTSVQWILGVGRDADRALPFYSRYHTAGTAGVDVLD